MRTYFKVRGDRAEEATGEVVREQPLTLYINGQRFLTLLCSPMKLEALVVGYLWMEKVIEALDDVVGLTVSPVDGRADITLRTDHRLFPRLQSRLRVQPQVLSQRMKELFAAAVHYKESRGIHGAALAD